MTHKTLVIDLDRCIGCFACEMACKQENNVPLGVHYNKVLSIGPMGKFPDLTQYFLPTANDMTHRHLLILQRDILSQMISNSDLKVTMQ